MRTTKPFRPSPVNHLLKQPIIVHQWLAEQAATLPDPFYRTLAQNASINILPKGFFFESPFVLAVKKGTKFIRVRFSENREEAIEEFIQFMHVNLGPSPLELTQTVELLEEEELTTWKGSSKQEKECLKTWFITDMIIKYNLNPDEQAQFKEILQNAFFFQQANESTILLKNGVIDEITVLEFDQSTRTWSNSDNVNHVKPQAHRCTSESRTLPEYKPAVSKVFQSKGYSTLALHVKKLNQFMTQPTNDYQKTFKQTNTKTCLTSVISTKR